MLTQTRLQPVFVRLVDSWFVLFAKRSVLFGRMPDIMWQSSSPQAR